MMALRTTAALLLLVAAAVLASATSTGRVAQQDTTSRTGTVEVSRGYNYKKTKYGQHGYKKKKAPYYAYHKKEPEKKGAPPMNIVSILRTQVPPSARCLSTRTPCPYTIGREVYAPASRDSAILPGDMVS